jgi:DNA-nicking Smr family endonuclease
LEDDKDKKSEASKLDSSDLSLWKKFTEDIVPFKKNPYLKTKKNLEKSPKKQEVNKKTPPEKVIYKTILPETSRIDQPHQLDRKTAQNLKKGKIKIEARLDLHGMNKSEAYSQLLGFITRSQKENKRCVLVITGKGRDRTKFSLEKEDRDPLYNTPEKGVLRKMVPIWLSESPLSDIVLQHTPSKPKDGGEGALYVYLKRNR